MKNKKFKSFICFLLCFVLLFSFPLNTTAHAAVAAPYVMYAIITYLASLGITFTVVGGVDAMIQAMEEKVDEYQQQAEIIDFYDIVRSGLKIVPPPNGGPNWDKNKGYFFLAFNAAMALTSFADWLLSDGDFTPDTTVTSSLNTSTFTGFINLQETLVYTTTGNFADVNSGDLYTYSQLGTVIPFNWDDNYVINSGQFYYSNLNNNYNALFQGEYQPSVINYANYRIYWQYRKGTYGTESRTLDAGKYAVNHGYGDNWMEHAVGITFVYASNRGVLVPMMLMDDNKLIALYTSATNTSGNPNDLINLSTEVEIMTPEEITFPSFTLDEGILLETGATAAETLEELGELFETVFTDTGTIPQPQPEVITDPDYAPEPTPVPTPVPSPEIEDIEDLGLPALGEAIFNKFPFSLPKDIARIFDILTAEPVTPYWEVDLTNDAIGISSKFVIDLEPYETVGQICRWVSVISFSLFLIIITKGMIGW